MTGGNDTQDKIFLLSYAEAYQYYGVIQWKIDYAKGCPNQASRVQPTAYVIAQGAYKDRKYTTADGAAAVSWWLRSPGYHQYEANAVRYDGSFTGYNVD